MILVAGTDSGRAIDSRELHWRKYHFALFRDLIAGRTGIYFNEPRQNTLRRAIDRRVRTLGGINYSAYFSLANSDNGAEEFQRLIDLVAIQETDFFRYKAHFAALAEAMLPELFRRRRIDEPIRIWSAGCATGQEPYSIAMTILGHPLYQPSRPVSILATDISQAALAVAEAGFYRTKELRHLSKDIIEKHFEPAEGGAVIKPQVRSLVQFERLNLAAEPTPAESPNRFDLIFCRNVTIYFSAETTRSVLNNLSSLLADDGYLFLGHSETLWQITDEFVPVAFGDAFYHRRRSAGPLATPPAH